MNILIDLLSGDIESRSLHLSGLSDDVDHGDLEELMPLAVSVNINQRSGSKKKYGCYI